MWWVVLGEDGRPDTLFAAYALACASCFGISHLDAIHFRLLRWVPTTYGLVNPVLPFGRAIFLLACLQRGAENSERYGREASVDDAVPASCPR